LTARISWHIPHIWPDSTVFILGGGPSLADVDLERLHSQRCIGVNQAYKLGPWVDVCYFGDCGWYGQNLPGIRSFAGLKITSCARCPERGWKHVHRVRRTKATGIESKYRDAIAWNNNSGASAINIAYWLGAKKIILLGFDMRLKNGRKNYHDDYHHDAKNPELFAKHLRGFPQIARDAEELGVEILNATPDSAITAFSFVDLNDIL
jgi:hypothetical protein